MLILLIIASLAAAQRSPDPSHVLRLPKLIADEAPRELICRHCGHVITRETEIMPRKEQGPSPATIDYEYEMGVVGVNTSIHVFTNPAGERFHVLNTRHASVKLTTEPSGDATWYPKNTWVITTCRNCGTHMGWYFEPFGTDRVDQSKSFHGIVMDKVISAEYCDSLIRVPGGKP